MLISWLFTNITVISMNEKDADALTIALFMIFGALCLYPGMVVAETSIPTALTFTYASGFWYCRFMPRLSEHLRNKVTEESE